MIAVGEERRLGKDIAAPGALQDNRGTVSMMADQLNAPADDLKHGPHRIALMKDEGASLEFAPCRGNSGEQIHSVIRHDIYYVG